MLIEVEQCVNRPGEDRVYQRAWINPDCVELVALPSPAEGSDGAGVAIHFRSGHRILARGTHEEVFRLMNEAAQHEARVRR